MRHTKIRIIAGALAGLFALAGAPAIAGSWVETPNPDPMMRTLSYQSEYMLPGERVQLQYSGAIRDERGDRVNVIALAMVLSDDGRGGISGFDGISLRPERNGADLTVLYGFDTDPFVPSYSELGVVEPWQDCYESPLEMLFYNGREVPPICYYSCYESAEDAMADRNFRACSSEGGTFIAVLISGVLLLDPTPTNVRLPEVIDRANYLIAKVRHGDKTQFSLEIDQAFRNALAGR
jgi:hypothetical protein